ncbi:hypothetical protein GXW82_28735 [Streptacidiphilus sp. 4-A2]|nr:hypothetical protein [Streptacidiphilus sp. 4-A2]
MHAHSDLALLTDPAIWPRPRRGSPWRCSARTGSPTPRSTTAPGRLRGQLAGWNGEPEGLDWSWRSVGEYLDRLDAGPDGRGIRQRRLPGPARHPAALVLDWEDRPATAAELRRMRALLAQACEGAVGLSAGLTYSPGMYADTDELVELCRGVAEFDGYFCPHHRSYGADALAAYAETIDIARRSAVRCTWPTPP